ncbi:hypothetical protein C5167_033679 [Papaver somniferum]|uniref:Uncharacterized protein n=1 Tax=Papaver somniferum TaxID=3469 RepID=A0A4Y7KEF0_PAPSO|nr:hypothetical protein C5167_033679 [Papaver somniferum]
MGNRQDEDMKMEDFSTTNYFPVETEQSSHDKKKDYH